MSAIHWPRAHAGNTDVGWMQGEAETERWHHLKGES